MNAVSDNPVVFPEQGDVVSGGNFHGQPVATALDALTLATVPLASVSERRLYRILDSATSNGLPPFLVADAGRGLISATFGTPSGVITWLSPSTAVGKSIGLATTSLGWTSDITPVLGDRKSTRLNSSH